MEFFFEILVTPQIDGTVNMTVASKAILYVILYVNFIFIQSEYAYAELHPTIESELNRETRKAECCAKKMRCCKKVPPPPAVEIRAVIARCIDPPQRCYRDRNIQIPLNKADAHNLQHFLGFDEDEPLIQSEVTKCGKKLVLTIKIKNAGETNTRNQYIVVDHVFDPIADRSVRLLNPYVIKMKQEQTSQAYMIKFMDFVNSQAREHVYNKHDGNYTGCCVNEKKPTCGLVTYKGLPIKYSAGFCCSCDAEKNAERQAHTDQSSVIAYSDPAYLLDSVQCPRTQLDLPKAMEEKQRKMLARKFKKKLLAQQLRKDNQKRNNMDDNFYYINPQNNYRSNKMEFGDDNSKEDVGDKFVAVKHLDADLSTEMDMMLDSLDKTAGRKVQEPMDITPDSKFIQKKHSKRTRIDKPYNLDIRKIADKAFNDAFNSLNKRHSRNKYFEKQIGLTPEDLQYILPRNIYKKRQVQSSGIQRRGGQNCADRYTPPNLNPDSYHESTHCLRFSPVWYGVYKLASPIVKQQILFQVYQKYETPSGQFKWKDLTHGEKVKMGTFWPYYRDKTPTISMTYNSMYDDANYCLDWKGMRLLIPEGLKVEDLVKYPEARGGPAEFLMVPTDKIVTTGDQCNVAGVGFEAFFKQPNRCSMPRGSCLHHQPFHLWHYDKDLERRGKPGCFFLKHYGKLSKNPISHNTTNSEKYLSLNYYGLYESVIDMEINADTNAVLRPVSVGVITEVYIDSTCPSRTAITVKVSNAGLLSSRFMVRICDCPLEVQPVLKGIISDLITIPPQNQHIFNLVVHAALHVDIFHCSAEVLNSAGELVALRRIKIQKLDRCICTWHCLCACIGSATGLKCIPMKIDHYHAAGFKGGLPIISKVTHVTLSSDVRTLILFIMLFVVFLLFVLGLTKALLGLCCTTIGIWGLDILLNLPKPMGRYYDKDLMNRPVQYDADGWPIHPDTGEKMRNIPATTEFCINVLFFFTYPTIMFIILLTRICHPFHKYPRRPHSNDEMRSWIKEHSCEMRSCLHQKRSKSDDAVGGKESTRKKGRHPMWKKKVDDTPDKSKDGQKKSNRKLVIKEGDKSEPRQGSGGETKSATDSGDNRYYYTSTEDNIENTSQSASGKSGKKSNKAKSDKGGT